jgi:ferredoxin-NADP reductase
MRLVVSARVSLADDVLGLTLTHPAGELLPAWDPGAHVDLVLRPDLVRQYSLCGDPADRRAWRIAVLREPAGRGGSAFVHERLAVGERVDVAGPRNRFPLLRSPSYLFIAGGVGVTPILPMLAAAERAGARWRLVYGGRRLSSMAFRAELGAYGARVTTWPQDRCGLLDLESLLGTPEPETLVYCCGPEPLLAAVEERCRAWPAGALHVERFAAARPLSPSAGTGFAVELRATGRTLTVEPGSSILRAVEEAGVAVLSSCREGTCGTCETDVLDGVPDHRDSVLTDAERAAGDVMMICVSRSLTPRLVLDL